MTSRISAIALDSVDPTPVVEFWCAALGWVVLESDATGTVIGAADGSWPTMEIARVPEEKAVKNRLHLDLRADGRTQDDELERLLGLGARQTDVGQSSDVSWIVLADPEGNEFCLLSRSVQEVSGTGVAAP